MKNSTYRMKDLQKYFLVPYVWRGNDSNGCDCYGFVELWYKNELGIELPSYERRGNSFREINAEMIEQYKDHKFFNVDKPETHDVVYMKDAFGVPRHVGIYIDGHILHMTEICGTLMQRESAIKTRIISYHRYKHEDKIV